MGGSLDDIIGKTQKGEQIEVNAMFHLKEMYESRIDEIKEHLNSVKRDKKILSLTTMVLVSFIIALLILDLSIGSRGWILY